MANKIRQQKISMEIMKLLNIILQREMKNSAFTNITIHEVKASPDLSIAKIYYSVFLISQKEQIAKLLQDYSKEIRAKLASKLTIFKCPTLNFIYDNSLDNANNIENIIKKINHDD